MKATYFSVPSLNSALLYLLRYDSTTTGSSSPGRANAGSRITSLSSLTGSRQSSSRLKRPDSARCLLAFSHFCPLFFFFSSFSLILLLLSCEISRGPVSFSWEESFSQFCCTKRTFPQIFVCSTLLVIALNNLYMKRQDITGEFSKVHRSVIVRLLFRFFKVHILIVSS